MAVKNEFEDVMKTRTFAELTEIVKKKRDDYQPEAVAAAEAELEKRKADGEKWEAPPKEEPERKLSPAEKAILPLPLFWKIITLLLPGLLNLTMAERLRKEGFKKQCDDLWSWFFYGLLFYVGLLVLLFVLSQILDG